MKKLLVACVSSVALAGVLLAASATGALAQNIAIVNGKPVPKARADALAEQVARSGRPITPEITAQIREEVIAREVFMQEAKKRNLDTTEDFKNQLELARQTILIRDLFVDFQKNNPISDAEVKAQYDKFAAANSGKEYKARHILVDNEDEAKKLIADIKKGAKFEDLAKKFSKDPGSGAKGGDLDWATASSYVPEFSQAMVKLDKGKMTDTPVKTQFGWHIIRVDDIRTAQMPPLEQVKAQIIQQLQQQKLAAFQQELRAKAKIE